MELYGHAITFYYALREFVPKSRAEELVKQHTAKLCLTDAFRNLVRPTAEDPDIVKFGRGYSHFTDGCGMRLPIGEELKNITNITETQYVTGKGYRNKFADQPTDFRLFHEMNPHLFEGDFIWGLAVQSHLEQDVGSDKMWQHNLCLCDTEKDEVQYVLTETKVTGKMFRDDMVLANIWCHRFFREMVKEKYGDEITQEWLNEFVIPSFYMAYPIGMAANTAGYLNMDARVFDDSDESSAEIVNTLISHGLIVSELDLEHETQKLFFGAVANCNALVNHLVRM